MKISYKPAKVWYLELLNPKAKDLKKEGFRIEIQKRINIHEYKQRYREVGETWDWANRLVMDENLLQAHLDDAKNEIYYAYYQDEFCGYFELDCHQQDIELVYFGLSPKFIGKGLGKLLMQAVFQKAASHNCPRLWLHTCELDSPQALEFYLKNGFLIFDEKFEDQTIITEQKT